MFWVFKRTISHLDISFEYHNICFSEIISYFFVTESLLNGLFRSERIIGWVGLLQFEISFVNVFNL